MRINPSNLDMRVSARATLSFRDRLPKPGHVQYNGVEGKFNHIQFLAMIFRSDLPTIIQRYSNAFPKAGLDSVTLPSSYMIQIFHT